MKKVMQHFIKGLMVITPFVISIYLFFVVLKTIDGIGKIVVEKILHLYIPGLGLIFTITFILLVGYLSELWLSKQLLSLLDKLFVKVPLLKIVYETAKEALKSFGSEKKSFSKVVRIQEGDAYRIGFLATENVDIFKVPDDYVVVYIPHGMQVSGEIKLIKKEYIDELDMTIKEALSFSLSAGVVTRTTNK